MDYDSYRGDSVRLRYFIRITVCRTIAGIVNEFPFWVANPLAVVPSMEPIKVPCPSLLCRPALLSRVWCCLTC